MAHASNRVQQIETELFERLKASEYGLFDQTFNLYLGLYPATRNTLYLKSLALLYYLSREERQEYNVLIQSLRLEDLEDDNVKFLLQVEDRIHRCDLDGLKKLADHCGGEARGLMEALCESIEKRMKQVLAEDIRLNETVVENQGDNLQNIADCIFICKNFADN